VSSATSFAVLAYPTKERATEALALITELGRTDALTLKDAAVVLHTAEGRVEVEQARELSAGQGAVAGGVAGFLLGLALGAVVPATLVGLAGGGALGVFDTGIDNRHLRELGATLEPGAAALGRPAARARARHPLRPRRARRQASCSRIPTDR
jgi:uncharacterized membrane protein